MQKTTNNRLGPKVKRILKLPCMAYPIFVFNEHNSLPLGTFPWLIMWSHFGCKVRLLLKARGCFKAVASILHFILLKSFFAYPINLLDKLKCCYLVKDALSTLDRIQVLFLNSPCRRIIFYWSDTFLYVTVANVTSPWLQTTEIWLKSWKLRCV